MLTITKLYFFNFRFWFLPQFLLRGLASHSHMGSIVRMDPKLLLNCPDVSSCPGLPLQARNHFSKVIGLNPPPLRVLMLKLNSRNESGKKAQIEDSASKLN